MSSARCHRQAGSVVPETEGRPASPEPGEREKDIRGGRKGKEGLDQ